MKKTSFNKNIYNTLLQSYRPYLFKFLFVIIIGFLGRFILLSNASLIAKTLDQQPTLSFEILKSLSVDLGILLSVSLILTLIYRTSLSRISALAISRLYDETTYRVSRFPMSYFDAMPVGKITTRFSSDYGNAFRLFGGPLAEFLSILFDLISILILMLMTHPYFLITLSFAGFLFYFILKLNQSQLRSLRRDMSILRGPSVAHFSETLQGAFTIRTSKKEPLFIERFQELNLLFIQCKKKVILQILKFSIQLNTLSTLLFFVHGVICLKLYLNQSIGAGQITVILSLTVLATQTLQMFFEWYSQFDEALIGVERLDELLRSPIEQDAFLPFESDFNTSHPHKKMNVDTKKSLDFENLKIVDLTFKYPSTDLDVLKNINLTIRKGDKWGLIGRTGAGKSSLISAILKLYPIDHGTILINHQMIEDIDHYRNYFALISQDQFFIRGTLHENLDLFKNKPVKEIQLALDQVGFKKSLDFKVEEKGANLSQGEKQLISLARGLLQKSQIFIFDEATANIDPQTEILIEKALKETLKNTTQIRIAHRLKTVEDCDYIVWLDQGQIKKVGPPQEVLEEFIKFS